MLSIGVLAMGCCSANLARAQSLEQYLPISVPGFDPNRGANIGARPRSEYDPLGIRVGEFTIRPRLDEAIGYDDNVLGRNNGPGSFIATTTPSVSFGSDFGRNSLNGSFGINDNRYLDSHRQTFTDYNAALGGTYMIGNDTLTAAATEIYEHQTPTSIDSGNIQQPLGLKATDIRLIYDKQVGRWQFEPAAEYLGYRFDSKIVPGDTLSQKARNRDVYVGGLTTRFGVLTGRNAVLVIRGIESRYIASLGGAPRPNSTAYEALVGFDYAVSGNLLVTALVGYEVRQFESRAFSNRAAPVAEASAIFTPTGLTTLTARLTRSIEDSIGESTTGVTITRGRLVVDHELRRNILLQLAGGAEYAEFSQGGTELVYSTGVSANYRFNRNIRLGASYSFSARSGTNNNPTIGVLSSNSIASNSGSVFSTTGSSLFTGGTGSSYIQNVFLLRLGFAL